MIDYEQYRSWATIGDHVKLDAIQEHGGQGKAAIALGISVRTLERALVSLRARAKKQGYDPDNDQIHPVPDTQSIKGVSTLYDADGSVKMQWVKSQEKKQQAIHDLIENYEPKPFPVIPKPKKKQRKLCAFYTITDFHIGMFAWGKECGADWDTKIAGETFIQALKDMAEIASDCEEAILNIQGDFLHYDSLDSITPMNKHLLDSDTRFPRMCELSIDLIDWACELLLKTHKKVRVIAAQGNHDLVSMVWIRKHVKKTYSKNKRLLVNDSENEMYAELFGKTFIGIHHGHRIKKEKLPQVFSCDDFTRELWGQAAYSHIHVGHYHSEVQATEIGGAVVTQHPTLSARDAYAVKNGYQSRSRAFLYIYDDNGDEKMRYTIRPPERT